MPDMKIKTGETYCQTCETLVAVRLESKTVFNEAKKETYWEASIFCQICGCFIYSYNIYTAK